ncbi:hypothetical protein HK097_001783, partial [Rhizophlyctis rosea]
MSVVEHPHELGLMPVGRGTGDMGLEKMDRDSVTASRSSDQLTDVKLKMDVRPTVVAMRGKSPIQIVTRAGASDTIVDNDVGSKLLSRRNTRDSGISISSYRSIAARSVASRSKGRRDSEDATPQEGDNGTSAGRRDSFEPSLHEPDNSSIRRSSIDSTATSPSIHVNFVDENISPPPPPSPTPSISPSALDPTPTTPIGDNPTTTPAPSDDAVPSFTPKPFSSSAPSANWRPLNEEDSWAITPAWSNDPGMGQPHTTTNSSTLSPLNLFSSQRRPSRQHDYFSSSRRSLTRRPLCRRGVMLGTIAFLVVMTMVTIIVVVAKATSKDPFNGSAGPRGGVPMAPPGPPLPVILGASVNRTGKMGGAYFGVSIDWNLNDPESFNKDLGRNAAIQDGYYDISSTLELMKTVNSSGVHHVVDDYFDWTSNLIAGTGAIMGITLMPSQGLLNVSMEAILMLGAKCKEINERGVPVMLRFAPEMNGNWYSWGQDPDQYVRVFRQIATIVHNMTGFSELQPGSAAPLNGTTVGSNTTIGANGTMVSQDRAFTAMVWAPAPAQRYPFNETGRSSRYSPGWNSTRWRRMDTNGDGRVDEEDDPYSPYYPGDEYVDWIGVTALFYGPAVNTTQLNLTTFHPENSTFDTTSPFPSVQQQSNSNLTNMTYINPLPPVGLDYDTDEESSPSFEGILTGYGTRWNLYEGWVRGKGKPMVVSETGYGYYLDGVGVEEGLAKR